HASVVLRHGLDPFVKLYHCFFNIISVGVQLSRYWEPAIPSKMFGQFFWCLHASDRVSVVKVITQRKQIIFICSESVKKYQQIGIRAGCFVRPANMHTFKVLVLLSYQQRPDEDRSGTRRDRWVNLSYVPAFENQNLQPVGSFVLENTTYLSSPRQ